MSIEQIGLILFGFSAMLFVLSRRQRSKRAR
jgi:hypothetical protein